MFLYLDSKSFYHYFQLVNFGIRYAIVQKYNFHFYSIMTLVSNHEVSQVLKSYNKT